MLTITASCRAEALPHWALLQRKLIAELDASIYPFLAKYTDERGWLRWGGTAAQHGRDDKDDFYEAFYNWPLLYLLGGHSDLLPISHRAWEAVTEQLGAMALVSREFDVGADFFHTSEGLTFFFLLCLADPLRPQSVERARRFADMYTGADPLAPNYDSTHRIIRAPHTGAKGPLAGYRDGDPTPQWPASMSVYGLPFDDVLGVSHFDDLADPGLARRLGEAMNVRFGKGDVVANLGVTSLVTNAFLITGDARYRAWTLEYVDAWRGRAAANGGIIPDNVGIGGQVGEDFDGRWYGGLYGWQWPHGLYNIGMVTAIAGMNAHLISGDATWLDLPRWQMDRIFDLAEVRDIRALDMSLGEHWMSHLGFLSVAAMRESPDPVTVMVVPYRHKDSGWFDYQPVLPTLATAVWYGSMADDDAARLEALRKADLADWCRTDPGRTKEDACHEAPWLRFLAGDNPAYPVDIQAAALANVARRLAQIEADTIDLTVLLERDAHTLVHHWQKLNPVTTEALVQLTTGAPQHLYNGGLLFGRLRYFDALAGRPGLPPDVAALVRCLAAERTVVELVNIGTVNYRAVILQAGSFAEHWFCSASWKKAISDWPGEVGSYNAPPVRDATAEATIDAAHFRVDLPPGHRIVLDLSMRLNTSQPTYAHPTVMAMMNGSGAQ